MAVENATLEDMDHATFAAGLRKAYGVLSGEEPTCLLCGEDKQYLVEPVYPLRAPEWWDAAARSHGMPRLAVEIVCHVLEDTSHDVHRAPMYFVCREEALAFGAWAETLPGWAAERDETPVGLFGPFPRGDG